MFDDPCHFDGHDGRAPPISVPRSAPLVGSAESYWIIHSTSAGTTGVPLRIGMTNTPLRPICPVTLPANLLRRFTVPMALRRGLLRHLHSPDHPSRPILPKHNFIGERFGLRNSTP